jgi:DNA polymerase (family 10)
LKGSSSFIVLDNSQLAELLATESERAVHPVQRALRRASRRAFLWEVEASQLVREGRSLTELSGVGPYIEKKILTWFEDPPPISDTPPLRRGFLTLTQARRALSESPNWLNAIRGDLQMHTTWSDGSGSIAEMVEAARERGYEYIAITDHSKGLKIAGGIDETQLRSQAAEIETINSSSSHNGPVPIALRSIELNLNPQGQGDMDPRSLRRLDVVLGCFHSSLRRKEDQTERYLAALKNPNIQILGHPRGRIYNFRMGLQAEWKKVFATAAELDKAVEIDGYPDRQDLNVDLLRIARSTGVRISLGTDSHGPSQLRFMELAAAAALIAGVPKNRILNCMKKDELLGWVEIVRSRALTRPVQSRRAS